MNIISLKFISFLCFYILLSACTNDKVEIHTDYWKNKYGEKENVRKKVSLRNGVLDGYCYRYYPNGQLMSKAYYKEEHLIRIECVFDTLGRKLNFGKLDETGTGYVITYSEITGEREYSGFYKNGRREGWWKNSIYEGGSNDSIFYVNSHPDISPSLVVVMY